MRAFSITTMVAVVRMREDPFRTVGKEGQAFSVSIRHFCRRYQKSPFRRCFKPRPPLSAGCAGFASGCRSRRRRIGTCPCRTPSQEESASRSKAFFRRRLSGLLSGPHRSTRGHRHVRNWAFRRIDQIDPRVNTFAPAWFSCSVRNTNGGRRCARRRKVPRDTARLRHQHVLELPRIATIHVLREQSVAVGERRPVGVLADDRTEIRPLDLEAAPEVELVGLDQAAVGVL